MYSIVGNTQYGVACDFGHEIEVVFEVQEPQQPVMRREWKSIAAASQDPLWKTHIKPAVRAEIEKIFEVHKSVVFRTRREMYDKMAEYASTPGKIVLF